MRYEQPAAARRFSRTFHCDLVRKFGTDGERRIPLVGTELTQLLRQRGAHFLRPPDRELAVRGRADELDGILFGEAEVDEKLPVVDFERQLLGLHRRLERQREVKREHRILGIEVEIIARLRIIELDLLSVRLGIGEEVVFLERGDVDLGERGQLFAGELALLLRLDALGREYREHVVEGPGVAHAGHRSVGPVDDLALDGHPDVGMRVRANENPDKRKALLALWDQYVKDNGVILTDDGIFKKRPPLAAEEDDE